MRHLCCAPFGESAFKVDSSLFESEAVFRDGGNLCKGLQPKVQPSIILKVAMASMTREEPPPGLTHPVAKKRARQAWQEP